MGSILNSVKEALDVDVSFTGFDTQIIFGINSAFMSLHQLGVGPTEAMKINGWTENWETFFGALTNIEAVKAYVVLKTRLFFDPPSSSFVLESMNRQITELEWRLNIQSESI